MRSRKGQGSSLNSVSHLVLLAALLAAPMAADAQVLGAAAPSNQPSLFARDHDTPVAERSFRGFEAVGAPVGAFRVFPSLGISLFGTSNVFENNKRREADGVARLTPEVSLNFDNSQFIFDLYARGIIDQYIEHSSENESRATIGTDLRRNLPGYSYIFANASYGLLALDRISPESPRDAASPIRFEQGQLDFGGVYERNRVRLTTRFDGLSLSYDDGQRLGGGVLATHERGRSRVTASFQAEYALSPATSVYVGGSGNTLNYRLDPPRVAVSRDSHGFEAFVGSNFEVTGLVRANVRVGYLDQIFDTASLGNISGLGVRGRLEYFPSRLTTVTVEARRSVQDSGIPNTGGYLETGGSVSIDHEYRRYIMLNSKVSYFNDDYEGIRRRDGIIFFSAGGTYISSHNWSAKVAYEYYHQNSHGCDCSINYDDHRLVTTLTFRY